MAERSHQDTSHHHICFECRNGIVGHEYVVLQLKDTYKTYHRLCATYMNLVELDKGPMIPKSEIDLLVDNWENKAADYGERGFTADHADYLDCAAELRDLLNRY